MSIHLPALEEHLRCAMALLMTIKQESQNPADVCSPTTPDAPAVKDYTAPGCLPYVRMMPEYRQLIALIGPNRARTETEWLPWGRLLNVLGWKNVLKGLEIMPADQRWPDRLEALAQQKRAEKGRY